MANALFDIYKEALLGGGNLGGTLIDLTSDTIKVAMIDTATWAVDETVDEDYADASGQVGTDQTLGTITIVNGTFDAADATFTAVSGNTVEELVIWKDTTTPATSPLLVSFDAATGLPVNPNGGDIVIQWNGSGIFSL
jgi:hypothetical protein